MSTLLLIDGHSQAYRAYFGVKTPLMTRSGELTTAVFGFARKLFSVLKQYRPEYAAVAFDLGDTWRHTAYPDYKATRDHMPAEMRSQMERIETLLRVLAIPMVTYPDYEADDVLGTLAKQAAAAGLQVLILTGDRDMYQLVEPEVQILYTSGGPNPQTSLYGPTQVMERYGLTPAQFVDMKALTGDSSDNIIGVPGIGEKTAAKFLQTYDSIDGIYAHIDQIGGPKTRQNLLEQRDLVLRNRRLVTIVTDLALDFDLESARLQRPDKRAVLGLFEELEFRSLIPEFLQLLEGTPPAASQPGGGQMSLFAASEPPPALSAPSPVADSPYRCVQDLAALQEVAEALARAAVICFDVETTSTDALQAALVGLAVAWAPGAAAYIPVGHVAGRQLSWAQVRAALAPYFAATHRPKVAHNAKYDLLVCRQHGLEVAGPLHDTMTLAWLLDPASHNLGLKSQARSELGVQMTELVELIGSGRKQITMDQVEIEVAAAYAAADADITLQLYARLAARLHETDMWPLYAEIELPLLPVLADMEMAGIQLDSGYLAEMSAHLGRRLLELEQQLFEIVGQEFNLRSTQQLSQVLFDKLALPTQGLRKTKSGHYSTAAGVLEALAAQPTLLSAAQQRVLDIILEQRQLEKLRGTYVDALPALVNPQTGRLHTSFSQTGASTGRMSSSNPNLQNIPIRTDLGREIRRAFTAPAGWQLLAADYSQVELRVLAHIIQEESLLAAFRAGQDIHAATASRLFGVPLEQVSRSQRGLAKTINFATIYGVSAYGLSSRSTMDPAQAQQFLNQYFRTYPKIQRYIHDTVQMANHLGYVETLLGRRRYFPELQNPRLPYNQRQAVERAAINAPIQGSAADIIKIAMVRLHCRLAQAGLRSRMLLQVHDELVLEVVDEERAPVIALVREVMESAYTMDLPLKVDMEIGPNWYELEPV